MDALGVESFGTCHLEQGQQHVAAHLGGTGLARYTKSITATGDLYIESTLDLAQVFIKLAAEIGEAAVVGGLENDVPRNLCRIQSTSETTQQPDCLQAGREANLVMPL